MRGWKLVLAAVILLTLNNKLLAQTDGTGYKIAIIDTGIIRGAFPSPRVVEQFCQSLSDRLSGDSYQTQIPDNTVLTLGGNAWYDYERASLCKNGATEDFTSSGAAEVPRQTWHWNQDYDWNYFSNSHGTNVARVASARAPGAGLIIVNNSYYDAAAKAAPDFRTTDCGVHGPDDMAPDIERPTRIRGCYLFTDAIEDETVMNRIVNEGNVAAINYSGGSINTNCNSSSALYKSIVDRGTAIIAAAGNSAPGQGATARVAHPACNTHVISVGSVNFVNAIQSYTNQVGNIDFFANDAVNDAYTGQLTGGTSYASPKVAGAFAAVRQALQQSGASLTPREIVAQSTFALTEAAFTLNKKVVHRGREVPIVDFAVVNEAIRCIGDGSCLVDTGNGNFDSIDYFDGGEYGPTYEDVASTDYTFEIDFENLGIGVQAITDSQGNLNTVFSNNASSLGAPSARDVVLTFDAKMSSNGLMANGFYIYINGTRRESISSFSNERDFSFTFKRTIFNSGNNTIKIEPRNATRPWGLSNVKADFTPVVEMALNVVDTSEYGSEEVPERPTGMRVSFELEDVDNEVKFAVTGYDINSADEVALYLNGKELANLSTTTALQYNQGDVFTFSEDDLLVGRNVIELVQKTNPTIARWGVKDMLIVGNSSSPTLQLGAANNVQYGNNYGTNENQIELEAKFTARSQHDHTFSWSAYDIERFGDLKVYLNGNLIKSANTTGNNSLGSTESITVAWRLLQTGVNSLSFRAKVDAFDDTWGVTNLLVDTSKVINLDSRASFNKDYGYYEKYIGGIPTGWTRTYSREDYQTRLYANFSHDGDFDRYITLQGWDIDSPEELSVYLNGTFLRHVTSASLSSIYSDLDRMKLPKEMLTQGTNTISFRTRNVFPGFQSEKWGVKFIGLSANSDTSKTLVPIIMLLLSDE